VTAPLRPLGHSSLGVTAIGLGCWQFSEGNGAAARWWPALTPETENAIVAASLEAGINWFDTAEMYGNGRSEAALARALLAAGWRPGDVVVATKWWPAFRTASSIGATIGERLARLAPFGIDLHQVHQPVALATVGAQMEAMADLVAAGTVRTVGVSNFSAARMRAAHRALAARGIPLVSNQMPYSLLDRRIERNGVLAAAKELGVTLIAYSPLAQGVLTGKYHDRPEAIRGRPGPRKWFARFRRRGLERSRPLVAALREIAEAHGATPAQVALAWLVTFHGDTVVAIPGAVSPAQAVENAGALRLALSAEELSRLDRLSWHQSPTSVP
jgi:aryl-alcohol dehydrogenase-like predicted oxidoreductase